MTTGIVLIFGMFILFIGGVYGVSMFLNLGEPQLLIFVVFAGFTLIGIAKIITYLKGIYYIQLGIPLDRDLVKDKIARWPIYHIRSHHFPLEGDSRHSLVQLDDEWYVRTTVFAQYVSHSGFTHTFRFPGKEEIVLSSSTHYIKGISMFDINDTVFVKLSALGYELYFDENTAYIV
ncbi:hypothetical protein [Paenibacillus sp. OSY-SE]|uniref:hypothetical protein n=1 Tax=Paenibacillus sp. OSY-SE TaxID=1196323 RepID=UPI0002E8F682|nr:hypothetical protein [Paenibacillus sp. OSY-SE]